MQSLGHSPPYLIPSPSLCHALYAVGVSVFQFRMFALCLLLDCSAIDTLTLARNIARRSMLVSGKPKYDILYFISVTYQKDS